ncbi:MAG: RNA pseudouridine synthase [Treponema sp.]|nr:RNA pseudouridine synthase [Treponema sp.]
MRKEKIIKATEEARIIDETDDFAVLWKPPRMHCAPLKPGEGGTLLDWYAGVFPAVLALRGRKDGEGGLVHRLDFETRGLTLVAKNQQALEFLLARQDEGVFVKEYGALCLKAGAPLPGFPPPQALPGFSSSSPFPPLIIESFFRPFGPGRKQVRPVSGEGRKFRKIAKNRGGFYTTEISAASPIHPDDSAPRRSGTGAIPLYRFTVKIIRGFRHQIRCHLSWIGYPILNDPLYGAPETTPEAARGFLALRSQGLFFPDPRTGEDREYRLSSLTKPAMCPFNVYH